MVPFFLEQLQVCGRLCRIAVAGKVGVGFFCLQAFSFAGSGNSGIATFPDELQTLWHRWRMAVSTTAACSISEIVYWIAWDPAHSSWC